MCEDNWMDEVRKELLTRCPTVANILSTLLDCSVEKPEKHLSPLCLLYEVITFIRCHHLSWIQRINTVLMIEGNASGNVSYFELILQHSTLNYSYLFNLIGAFFTLQNFTIAILINWVKFYIPSEVRQSHLQGWKN